MSPSTTVPEWHGSMPVTARASVVFPAPLTPISATTVPAGTSMDTERRTVIARPYRTVRSRTTSPPGPGSCGSRITTGSSEIGQGPESSRGTRPGRRSLALRGELAAAGRHSGVVDDQPADELPVLQVLVALIDLVQGVPAGDELVELELAVPVEAQQ